MTKTIGQREFIALTACITLSIALAIDIMLPAFAEVRGAFHLGADSTVTARIVTFFFLGQLGQLLFGPLSDSVGRLPVMRMGFVLYIGGCVVAALSPNLTVMLAARFVVGMGAAALSVSAGASVRDRFVGDTMARTLSLIQTIFLLVPIVAPFVGSAILSATSWQIVFLTPAILATLIWVWSFRLNESLVPENRLPLNVSTLIQSGRAVCSNRVFLRYTAITIILFATFSSFISSSERIVGVIFGQPEWFVWIFAANGVTMALFTFLNAQVVGRFGAQRLVRVLLTSYLIIAAFLLGMTLLGNGTPNMVAFFGVSALLQGITVAVNPNSSALALEPLGKVAGMASAINGTSFFVIGSSLGSLIDRLLVGSVTPLAVGYVIVALIAFALVTSGRLYSSFTSSQMSNRS
jgi:MFS transporter, DHA1 family, multidrug resistance protein